MRWSATYFPSALLAARTEFNIPILFFTICLHAQHVTRLPTSWKGPVEMFGDRIHLETGLFIQK